MRESTSTSEHFSRFSASTFALAAALALLLSPGLSRAAEGGADRQQSHEDDYADTPFTEYAEFNEESDEAAETKFLQYGRFFGVSIGLGFEGTAGNRGLLYQGGFPMIDFKVHYWFDFNLALDLGFFSVSHFYDTTVQGAGHVDSNIFRIGLDIKYYFDTKNISAPISFANPYVLLGAGSFSKTEVSANQASTSSDSSFALSLGGGLEFVMTPRKTFFEVEGKIHLPTFKDTYTTLYQSKGIEDLTGLFYTFSGNILFTW